MNSDEEIRQRLNEFEASSQSAYPRIYVPLVYGSSVAGLLLGFPLGWIGTYAYARLTTDESAFGFLYGLGHVMLLAGIVGTVLGGVIAGTVAHFLALSRFSKYAPAIVASIILAIVSGLVFLYYWV